MASNALSTPKTHNIGVPKTPPLIYSTLWQMAQYLELIGDRKSFIVVANAPKYAGDSH